MTATHLDKVSNLVSKNTQKSLTDIAYEEIKIRILTLDFEPGSYLNEATITRLLKISRSPIHHAVKKLVFEGLIEIIPRKGMIIKPVQFGEIQEVAEARIINETYCVRRAAERATNTEISKMQKIIDDSYKALKSNDTETQMFLDRDFHCAISKAAGNKLLEGILQNLHERSLRNWFISLREYDQAADVLAQHSAIFSAIEAKNPDEAERQMIIHIDSSRSALMKRF